MAQEGLFAGRVEPIELGEEIQRSYLDYAMSVIVGRALPEVRDGLKPVHRRILWSMLEAGLRPDRPHRKSAWAVGEVVKKYHPHGLEAVYDALVRMAQDFSLRYPLVDPHGNFGSVDGDPPAAMRYTEARLAPAAMEMLRDIDAETVDFVPNYDGYEQQPFVLPSRFPNLLVNGSGGIAVGMATNIPPHNMGEAIDAVVHYLEHPESTSKDLMKFVKGPDFPTGGIIMGRDGIRDAYETGRGSIKIRAVCSVEEGSAGRARIVVSELPYQVNKARLAEKIAELVKSGKVKEIADLKDHSSGRAGMRLVIDLKRGANPQVVLNQLYKHTQLQESFGVIMLALVDGVPRTLNLAEMIGFYVDHQIDVVTRRTRFDLRKAEERDHIVQGLLIALDHLDEVIQVIRGSQDAEQARTKLMSKFKLSEIQANHILDMPLRRLTKLARTELEEEHKELLAKIKYLKALLKDPKKIRGVIKEEILEIKKKHGDPRRTQIKADEGSFDIEDLIAEEDVVITVSRAGYVKRVPIDTFRRQGRGGKGVRGATLKEEDVVANVFTTTTHNWLLFFTTKGKVYRVKVHEVPDASRIARGLYAANLPGVAISGDEGVSDGPAPEGVRPQALPALRHEEGDGQEDAAAGVRVRADRSRRDQPQAGRRAHRREAHRREGRRLPRLAEGPGHPVQGAARPPDGPGDRGRDRDAPRRGRRGDLAQPRLRRRGDDQRLAAGVRQALAAEGLPGEGARRQGRDRPPDHEEDGPARRRVRRLEGAGPVRDLLERDRHPRAGRGDPPGRAVEPGRPHDARRRGRPRRRDRARDHADGGVAPRGTGHGNRGHRGPLLR